MRQLLAIALRQLITVCFCSAFAVLHLAAVAADQEVAMRLRVVDANQQPVAGAVIWFGDGYAALTAAEEPAVIEQIDKQFVPEITVIRAGASIVFPNRDSVAHHVYSFAQPNAFELPLYKSGQRPSLRFDHAGVVALGCNIHDSMLGYIVVVDSPHYALTDEHGFAQFDLPPPVGETVHVWSPRLDPAQPLRATVKIENTEALVAVDHRQRAQPRPLGGSLAWEDY